MTKNQKSKISRIAIVGAFVMAISCTVKITAFHLNMPAVAQWTNVIMNAMVVIGCYQLGRIVELRRSHRLLCATALLGYVFYGGVLLFMQHNGNENISTVVLLFFMLTLVMSIWFFLDIVLTDIREKEKMLERMENNK